VNIELENNPIKASIETTFVRHLSLFSASRVLGAFMSLIRSLIIAKILGPRAFGTWQFVRIFERYAPLAGLGTRRAITRRIPFLRAKGDVKEEQAVLRTAFVANVFGPLTYSVAVLGGSFFVTETFDAQALAFYSPVIFLLTWLGYNKILSMSSGLYSFARRLELLQDFSTALISVALVLFWGIHGVIVGFGISALICIIYSARKLWHKFSFKIEWRILWELIVTGLPIMANGMFLTTMELADKIMIAAMLNREVLGIYAVANAGIAILRAIPGAIGQMLFVKFAEMDGQNHSNKHMSGILDKSTDVLSSLFAPIVAVAIAFFPIAVVLLLPRFAQGIVPGRLLIADVFFLAVSIPATNWCISTGRFSSVLKLRLVLVTAEFAAVYVVIKNGARLDLIALCILSTSLVFGMGVIIMSNYLLENSLSSGIRRACKILLPFLSIVAAIWMQDYVYDSNTYVSGMRLYSTCILGLIVSLAVSIPFVYWSNKRTQIKEVLLKCF